jgi:hypothetical protein
VGHSEGRTEQGQGLEFLKFSTETAQLAARQVDRVRPGPQVFRALVGKYQDGKIEMGPQMPTASGQPEERRPERLLVVGRQPGRAERALQRLARTLRHISPWPDGCPHPSGNFDRFFKLA